MIIKLCLCQILSYYANNQPTVEVNGNTVRECLDDLVTRFPNLNKVIEMGKTAGLVNIYISNNKGNAIEDLSQPVKDGDELNVAFSGGG